MGDTRKDAIFGIPQFVGTGYENWKFRVEKYLKSVDLLEVLTMEVPASAAELTKFNEKDCKAANLIISFIHDDMLDLVREKNTAREVWNSLENVYAKKSVSSQTLVRKQLAKLKMSEGTSVREHLKIFDELIRKLKSSGAKLEESDMVFQLFVTLPESYDPLVTALENFGDGKLTLDVVRERLLAEEMKKTDRMMDTHKEKPAAFVGNKQKTRKFTGKCNRCHKKGHMAKDCRVKIQAEANVASGGRAVAFMVGRNGSTDGARRKVVFKLDSGASDHLVNEKNCFKELVKLNHPIIINVAKDNASIQAWHRGSITGVNSMGVQVTINEVLYVPDLRANLLSVKKLARADIKVMFERTVAKMEYKEEVIAVCPMRGDFYELDVFYEQSSVYACEVENLNLWHRRLGHLGSGNLKTLAGMVTGMPMQSGEIAFCEPCVFAKQCREPFNGTRVRAERPLELIHSDVCGPITPAAWDGSRYFVSFIDDYSHFAVVYMLKRKSEVFEKFRNYEAMATAATGFKISKMTVDQGREYCSKLQNEFYASNGIQIEPTVAYTPQQNGVSERLNRTIIEKVRAMLTESEVPKDLWNEAVLAAVYLMNRSPTSALKTQVTPVEMWTNHKPNISKLRVFGSKAIAWIPP